MASARLFRSFKSGPPESSRASRRKTVAKAYQRVQALKAKVVAREPLTDADHRVLAKCGPKTLQFIGYEPKVTL